MGWLITAKQEVFQFTSHSAASHMNKSMLLLLAVYDQMIRLCALMHRPTVSGHLAQKKNHQKNPQVKLLTFPTQKSKIQTDCGKRPQPVLTLKLCLRVVWERWLSAKPWQNTWMSCKPCANSQCYCINWHLGSSNYWLSIPSDKNTHTHTYICTHTL